MQTPAPSRQSMTGRLVKLGTTEPVVRARIVLARTGGQLEDYKTSVSDDAGAFTFRDLSPGTYRLFAEREGFIRTEHGQRGANPTGVPITLISGQDVQDVVVAIIPAGVITGRVLDNDRNPVRRVWVRALKAIYRDGQRNFNVVDHAETNDLGEYRVFGLSPGLYFVSAIPRERPRIMDDSYIVPVVPSIANYNQSTIITPGREILAAGGIDPAALSNERYLTVYHPGTTEAVSAVPIELRPGATVTGIDLPTVSVRTVRVRGQVINGVTGQPAQDASVTVVPLGQSGGVNVASTRVSMGAFELAAVPSGNYTLRAQSTTAERLFAGVPIVVGNRDLENIALMMQPGVNVPGRITIEGGATELDSANRPRFSLNLLPGYSALPQPDGTFSIPGVQTGDYALRVNFGVTPAFVKSAKFGPADASNGIRIESDLQGKQLEIVVSLNPGTLNVLVVDDRQRPVQGVAVAAVPDAPRRHRSELFRTATTDAAGRARIQGLWPGDYKLFAAEDIEAGAWQDPGVIRVYENRGELLQVREGATQTITLKVIPSGN